MATSRNDSFRLQALQLTDAALVFIAFWLAALLRDITLGVIFDRPAEDGLHPTMLWALYIAVPFTPLALERFGFYFRLRRKSLRQSVGELIKGIVTISLFLVVLAVFLRELNTSRLMLTYSAACIFILLLIRDRITIWILKKSAQDVEHMERVIIAGSGDEMETLRDELDPEIVANWNIIELFDLQTRPTQELYDLLKEKSVGRVVFAAKATEFGVIAEAVEACELQGVEAWIAASFIRTQIARPVFDAVGDRPMLVLRSTPELSWELMFKEIFDRVAAACIILGTLPLWIIAYIGIRIASPGAPVFFSQMRAGRYGRPFRMWKFRTMVPNAEELLDQIKENHGNQMEGPVFKLDHDPRIFPFGRILRRFSIDELPQLLNVVTGEISLVGPRPLPLYEVAAFCEITHRRRLSVKPGITCEWQVGGRNKITSFEEWVAMDLRYIDNWSLWLDFKIILKTIPAVIFGHGAK
jgi:exopolysaccharide biosynthesis polyprenyl glycosylphosphotransferase